MLPWSGHIQRATVTSGKRGICKLQLDHDAEGHLESKSSAELLKAGMECEGGIQANCYDVLVTEDKWWERLRVRDDNDYN